MAVAPDEVVVEKVQREALVEFRFKATLRRPGVQSLGQDDLGEAGFAATEKIAILKGWEADERALLRAEDEGMGGGEHAHLHKVKKALARLWQPAPSAASLMNPKQL